MFNIYIVKNKEKEKNELEKINNLYNNSPKYIKKRNQMVNNFNNRIKKFIIQANLNEKNFAIKEYKSPIRNTREKYYDENRNKILNSLSFRYGSYSNEKERIKNSIILNNILYGNDLKDYETNKNKEKKRLINLKFKNNKNNFSKKFLNNNKFKINFQKDNIKLNDFYDDIINKINTKNNENELSKNKEIIDEEINDLYKLFKPQTNRNNSKILNQSTKIKNKSSNNLNISQIYIKKKDNLNTLLNRNKNFLFLKRKNNSSNITPKYSPSNTIHSFLSHNNKNKIKKKNNTKTYFKEVLTYSLLNNRKLNNFFHNQNKKEKSQEIINNNNKINEQINYNLNRSFNNNLIYLNPSKISTENDDDDYKNKLNQLKSFAFNKNYFQPEEYEIDDTEDLNNNKYMKKENNKNKFREGNIIILDKKTYTIKKDLDLLAKRAIKNCNIINNKNESNKNQLKMGNGKLMFTNGLTIKEFLKKYKF